MMSDCQEDIRQDEVCYMTQSAFNAVKFRILLAIDHINTHGGVADSNSISELTGIRKEYVTSYMCRQMRPCVVKQINRAKGGLFKYKLSKKGEQRLDKMIWRKKEGYTLRLRGLPKKADYSDFVLLPGLNKATEEDNQK